MSWKDRMNAGIGEYLRSQGLDCITVKDFEEDVSVYDRGGCDTCGHDYDKDFNVTIRYTDSRGAEKYYYYDGSFVDFLAGIS